MIGKALISSMLGVLVILLIQTGLAFALVEPLQNARIVINIPSRTLWLYSGDQIVNYYPVGVGTADFPTPLGSFHIIDKVIDPDFENPFRPPGASQAIPGGTSKSPLGTRWMGFFEDNGGEYGIHGTNAPGTVGKFSSHGCIRMNVQDAEALFNSIDFGTPVDVTYEQVLVQQDDNAISLIVFPDVFGRGKPSTDDVKERILKQFPKAKLDDTVIAQALQSPAEKPVRVGKVIPEAGDPVLSVLGKLNPESPKDAMAKRIFQAQ